MERDGSKIEARKFSVEDIKAKFLPHLKERLDGCIDDLPPALVEMGDPNYYHYKCRTNWFNSVKQFFIFCLSQIRDPLYSEVETYIHHLEQEVDWKAMRTRGDIDRANDILKKVITYIETEM